MSNGSPSACEPAVVTWSGTQAPVVSGSLCARFSSTSHAWPVSG
jgi:phage gp37-like protein